MTVIDHEGRPLLIGLVLRGSGALIRLRRRSGATLVRGLGRAFVLLVGRVAAAEAGQETRRHNHAKQFFHGPSSFLKVSQT